MEKPKFVRRLEFGAKTSEVKKTAVKTCKVVHRGRTNETLPVALNSSFKSLKNKGYVEENPFLIKRKEDKKSSLIRHRDLFDVVPESSKTAENVKRVKRCSPNPKVGSTSKVRLKINKWSCKNVEVLPNSKQEPSNSENSLEVSTSKFSVSPCLETRKSSKFGKSPSLKLHGKPSWQQTDTINLVTSQEPAITQSPSFVVATPATRKKEIFKRRKSKRSNEKSKESLLEGPDAKKSKSDKKVSKKIGIDTKFFNGDVNQINLSPVLVLKSAKKPAGQNTVVTLERANSNSTECSKTPEKLFNAKPVNSPIISTKCLNRNFTDTKVKQSKSKHLFSPIVVTEASPLVRSVSKRILNFDFGLNESCKKCDGEEPTRTTPVKNPSNPSSPLVKIGDASSVVRWKRKMHSELDEGSPKVKKKIVLETSKTPENMNIKSPLLKVNQSIKAKNKSINLDNKQNCGNVVINKTPVKIMPVVKSIGKSTNANSKSPAGKYVVKTPVKIVKTGNLENVSTPDKAPRKVKTPTKNSVNLSPLVKTCSSSVKKKRKTIKMNFNDDSSCKGGSSPEFLKSSPPVVSRKTKSPVLKLKNSILHLRNSRNVESSVANPNISTYPVRTENVFLIDGKKMTCESEHFPELLNKSAGDSPPIYFPNVCNVKRNKNANVSLNINNSSNESHRYKKSFLNEECPNIVEVNPKISNSCSKPDTNLTECSVKNQDIESSVVKRKPSYLQRNRLKSEQLAVHKNVSSTPDHDFCNEPKSPTIGGKSSTIGGKSLTIGGKSPPISRKSPELELQSPCSIASSPLINKLRNNKVRLLFPSRESSKSLTHSSEKVEATQKIFSKKKLGPITKSGIETQLIDEFNTETLYLVPANTKSEGWSSEGRISEILSEERSRQSKCASSSGPIRIEQPRRKKAIPKDSLYGQYASAVKAFQSERRIRDYERRKSDECAQESRDLLVLDVCGYQPQKVRAVTDEGEAMLFLSEGLLHCPEAVYPGCNIRIYSPWDTLITNEGMTIYFSIRTCDVSSGPLRMPDSNALNLREVAIEPYLDEPGRIIRALLNEPEPTVSVTPRYKTPQPQVS